MRAVVFDAFGATPRVTDVPEPACPADGAVIRVGATGVCRSDWHAWQGHDADVTPPHTPGHELAGTVFQVGADVTGWTVGARVTVPFVCACGTCVQCVEGEPQVCAQQTQPGFTHAGSFADQVVVRHADVNLVGLPDDLPFVTAAGLGCRFATAFRAVAVHGDPRPGQWVAVLGCGGVGLSAVMVARALGAKVVAVDVSSTALEAAARLGADVTVDSGQLGGPERVGARLRELTGGGAHVSVDAFGSAATCVASIQGLRPRGTHVQVGLLAGADADPATPLGRVLAQELTVVGSHGMSARDYPRMLDLVAAGTLRPDRLVGSVITLEQAPDALVAMGNQPTGFGMTVVELD